jgi:hypothetical protein
MRKSPERSQIPINTLGKKLRNFGMKIFKLLLKQSKKQFKTLVPKGKKIEKEFKKSKLYYTNIQKRRKKKMDSRNLLKKRRMDKVSNLNDDLPFNKQISPDNRGKVDLYKLIIVQNKKLYPKIDQKMLSQNAIKQKHTARMVR